MLVMNEEDTHSLSELSFCHNDPDDKVLSWLITLPLKISETTRYGETSNK
jgi:hypothetical protein